MKYQKMNLYDRLIWILLVWCVFQDFFLSLFFHLTGSVGITKMLFFSKDIAMIILFFATLKHFKLPPRITVIFFVYYFFVLMNCVVSFALGSGTYGLTSMLSSVRGLILLPTFIIIGYSVRDKEQFAGNIKKYYKFLVFVAIFGLLEYYATYTVGTQKFWMDFLELGKYHEIIKGQPDHIHNGVPWNWYTNSSKGYLAQKRVISFWGAPLAAGFVFLLPAFYYTISFFKYRRIPTKRISKSFFWHTVAVICCVYALFLTYTRQTILPFFCIILLSFVYYNKKNRTILIAGGITLSVPVMVVAFPMFWDYFYNGSTLVHFIRIQESLQQVSLWGKGVASFGTRFSGSIATESQYVTVLGQLGVIPLVLYLLIFAAPLLYCRKKAYLLNDNAKVLVCSLCFSGIVYAAAGIVSETVAAYTSIAQYYILIGFAWGYCADMAREVKNES